MAKMVDIIIHVDEQLDDTHREQLMDKLRDQPGVDSVCSQDDKPQLMTVEYDPDQLESRQLLDVVQSQGVHGELVGL